MTTAARLRKMYDLMRRRFGHQNWWPGDTALEICIGAILTQNTSWQNVEKAIINLKRAGVISIKKLNEIPNQELAELIRPAGYFNIKAVRLKNFIRFVCDNYRGRLKSFLSQDSLSDLRQELLSINGIGPETADSIILYAANRPSFVIDAYTKRILSRHNMIPKNSSYDEVKKLFEENLTANVELFNDFHAQIVATAKEFCKTKPHCDGCPLEDFDRQTKI